MLDTRYFHIAGITIQVESDLAFSGTTFSDKLLLFEADGPGTDTVVITHRFTVDSPPEIRGTLRYDKSPWKIFSDGDQWRYVLESSPDDSDVPPRQISTFSDDHRRGDIWNGELGRQTFRSGSLGALSLMPTDQILLARLLADRSGCYLHADGVNLDGRGFLFVGHSGAGKSTIATLLREHAEILCDDRMIVRKWPEGFRIHGNWSHGSLPVVSPHSAPLDAIFFLEQAPDNAITRETDLRNCLSMLLGCLIRPLVTVAWWERMLDLITEIIAEVPCYRLQFDTSGEIVHKLRKL